jgi:hypothetical protein
MGQDSQSTDQARHRKRENGRPVESPSVSTRPSMGFVERHYTVAEIATMWNLSSDAARRMFENEQGVLVLGDNHLSSRKRRYTTLRIPASVVERVHRRLSKI